MDYTFKNFGSEGILKALSGLGAELGDGHAIELLVVGGAAGLLGGVLPGSVTTSDVDAIHFRPPGDVDEVLQAADVVAETQGFPKGWLNTDAGLFASAMAIGWEARRFDVGTFGRLRVFAISRLDLIAMKFFAHREVDLEHLAKIKVTPEELAFSDRHLRALMERLPDDRNKIEMAIYILQNWK